MKNLLSNISFFALMVALLGLCVSFIIHSEVLGLASGLSSLAFISLNVVVNSSKLLKS